MFDFDELEDLDNANTTQASASASACDSLCYRHRWAFNIDDWNPAGDEHGAEFQFLLGLIQEEAERCQVMKYGSERK